MFFKSLIPGDRQRDREREREDEDADRHGEEEGGGRHTDPKITSGKGILLWRLNHYFFFVCWGEGRGL